MSALPQSAAEYRKEARRLRALTEIITTPALRQILLDGAAAFDKLAGSAAFGRRDAARTISPIRYSEKDMAGAEPGTGS
jgi:hypothetical protein